jgi:hypothetical protein
VPLCATLCKAAGCQIAASLNAGQRCAAAEKLKIAVFQSESLVSALGFGRLLAACPALSLRPAS